MKVIKPEQVGSYLQAAAARNVLPMFFLELISGLRKGELLALLWGDLDIEKHSISVTKSVSRRGWCAGDIASQDTPLHSNYHHSAASSGPADPGAQSASK